MRTTPKSLWQAYEKGAFAVIECCLRQNHGVAELAQGHALQAAARYPELAAQYGAYLLADNPELPCWWPTIWPTERLILFPTKNHWDDPEDLPFLESQLAHFVGIWHNYCETLG